MARSSADSRHARKMLERLRAAYPEATCALEFGNPLEILVATILSAQCTDERVNQVTPSLFRKYRSAADYAEAPLEELKEAIRSTGFFNNKARNIQACCRMLVERYAGRVPRTLEELVALPGVGRKTANCVLGNAYGIAAGVVVDTHVARLSRRMGLSPHKDPEKIEQDLMRLCPRDEWIALAHRLIEHGRRVCTARKPKCDECVVSDLCPRVGVARGGTIR